MAVLGRDRSVSSAVDPPQRLPHQVHTHQVHTHQVHTAVVASSAQLLASLGFEAGDTQVLALAQHDGDDLLATLERHRHRLGGLHTLVLAAPCVPEGLQIGATLTTASSILRRRRRWRLALPAGLARLDLFVTAGSCQPELAHCLALVSGAEVRLAEPLRPLALTTVADGAMRSQQARNQITSFRRLSA